MELVITVAILATGIVVILQAFSFSARTTGLACDMINAVFLGEDKIQELEFKGKIGLISKGEASGTKEKFNWYYTLDLEPESNLYKLKLDITWQRLNREEKINLNTYLK